jgi:hypothetical protein
MLSGWVTPFLMPVSSYLIEVDSELIAGRDSWFPPLLPWRQYPDEDQLSLIRETRTQQFHQHETSQSKPVSLIFVTYYQVTFCICRISFNFLLPDGFDRTNKISPSSTHIVLIKKWHRSPNPVRYPTGPYPTPPNPNVTRYSTRRPGKLFQ